MPNENPNTNPFATVALDYLNKGLSVIPLAPKQKNPILSGWTKFCDQRMDAEHARMFFTSAHNIGLTLGPASNLCAVDIDTDDPILLEQIERILPESPVKKRGAKGYTAFYKYNGIDSKSTKTNDGTAGIDFLSTGRQTVLPPSVHPSGVEYKWITNETLLTCPAENIPEISSETLRQLFDLLNPETKNVVTHSDAPKPSAKVEDIKKALSFIPADIEYNEWSSIGMALHDFSGGATWACELFDSWSKTGSKYKEYEPLKKWDTYTVDGGITINTLFALARTYGYTTNPELAQIKKEREEEIAQQAESKKRLETLSKNLLPAPGLIGDVAQYIREVSVKKQPILTIAGAIVVSGTVYAQRAQTPSGLRSNVYCFAIGESGAGKGDPDRAIHHLFAHKSLREDLRRALRGVPASRTGLIDSIYDAEGKCLLSIDEIGYYIDAVNGKTAQAYSKEIIPELTRLYSSANTMCLGREYSQHGKDAKKRSDVLNPCVCVLGLSVPSQIYDVITKKDILDGFLPRWFILETTDIDPGYNDNRVPFEESSGCNLIKTINIITKALDEQKGKKPYTVPITIEANELLRKYRDEFNKARVENLKNGNEIGCLYTRLYENLEKLSLVASEIDPQTHLPKITTTSVNWACGVVLLSLERMKVLLEAINKSGYAKKLDEMEEKIKSINRPITMSEFGSKFRNIPLRERNALLEDLVLSGRVRRFPEGTLTKLEHMDNALKL